MFKLLVGIGKRLEGLMRQFMCKGSRLAQSQRLSMVSWDMVCRPTKSGVLGVLDGQTINVMLLTKWVAGPMSQQDDLTIQVMKDSYGRRPNWERCATLVRGVSPFWQGLRQIFPWVHDFFSDKLGNGSIF